MLWFQGAIPAAIASAKRSGAVFVVFVAGDDEQSIQMAASWEDEKVAEASSNNFVAIKIDTKSEACLQFSQIYPVVCVPSSFFIGDSGIPLEVIAGSVSADELVTRIHKVQQMHSSKGETSVTNDNQSESSVSAPSASFEPNDVCENAEPRNAELCETPAASDTKLDTATGGEYSGHDNPSQEPHGCSNQRPAEDLTVRVERLTKKLEERREEKRKEEGQREIKKEIERRKTGKEMLDYKRKQEEELTKRMLEERSREKAEDRAARERIKQQIALDRAERAARFAKTKEVEAAKAAALLARSAAGNEKMAASAVCRAACSGTQVLLRTRRTPALLRSPALRGTATFAQALQSVPETQVSVLDNGLRVASEQSSHPTCTVGVWIDAGSRYETEKNNGAGYFLEHLAFKGTKNRPGNALEKEIESMGAHLNAYSTREHTAYLIKALSKDLPKVVELLADIVQNCSLEDSQIEKERDVILREMQENDASMQNVVFDYLHATAFQGTPLGQAVEGPSENVRRLSRADLTDYINRHYKAPRMVLAAAGGVEHRQLLDLAQKHLSSVSRVYEDDAVPAVTPCRFTGSEIRHRDDALPLAHVAIAVEGPGWANPDNVALQVANAILGHYDCTYGGGVNLSSPLASVAVTNKLCQSFQTFNISYSDTGLLGAHFVCDGMSIDDMVFFLQGQWMRLCTSATESEVTRGKNILRNALVSHLDGTTPVCEDIGRSLLTYGRRIPLAEWESRIAEVDAHMLREVCSKYFYDQCPAVAGYGPIEQLPDYNRIRSGMFWLRF